jgi:hypothetical protein
MQSPPSLAAKRGGAEKQYQSPPNLLKRRVRAFGAYSREEQDAAAN